MGFAIKDEQPLLGTATVKKWLQQMLVQSPDFIVTYRLGGDDHRVWTAKSITVAVSNHVRSGSKTARSVCLQTAEFDEASWLSSVIAKGFGQYDEDPSWLKEAKALLKQFKPFLGEDRKTSSICFVIPDLGTFAAAELATLLYINTKLSADIHIAPVPSALQALPIKGLAAFFQNSKIQVFDSQSFLDEALSPQSNPFLKFAGGEDRMEWRHIQCLPRLESRIFLTDETKKSCAQSHKTYLDSVAKSTVYGASTGFGGNAGQEMSATAREGLQNRLCRYLDCGMGGYLDHEASRMAMALRIHVLAKGYSGISLSCLEALVAVYNLGICPALPKMGALGASGDLITMAPMALFISGQSVPGYVLGQFKKDLCIEDFGIQPVSLGGKDALAIMNGLSVATALGALAFLRLQLIWDKALHSTAIIFCALGGNRECLSAEVNSEKVRCFSGQKVIAESLAQLVLHEATIRRSSARLLQDEYSIRCLPQVLGPLYETLIQSGQWIANEINSVSDNPIVSPINGPLSGGNFYGGYICRAVENLSWISAKLADCLERQTFLLVDGKHDLPANLIYNDPEGRLPYQHGLKGLHQLSSSLTMRMQHHAIPASLFSRSSEIHNQDVVSNAMNAALVCTEQTQLLASIVVVHAAMAAQASELSELILEGEELSSWYSSIRRFIPFVAEDQSLREPLERFAKEVLKL